jgi:hypothetical protein
MFNRNRFASQSYRSVGNMNHGITDTRLRELVPSAFAETPWHATSERYQFIPTSDVIAMLRDRGFVPVKAQQMESRIEGKTDFTKHLIRFRSETDIQNVARGLGEEFFEVVLMNGHDGSSLYKFQAGVFRLVCLNGMVAATADMGEVKVRHIGGKDSDLRNQVIDATYEIVQQAPKVMSQVATWKQIEMKPEHVKAFGETVSEEILEGKVPGSTLVRVEREADRNPNLWNVVNRVQEHIIKGGVKSAKGRRTTAVKDINKDVKINTMLWSFTEKVAQKLGA